MSVAQLPCAKACIVTLSGLSCSITKAMFVPVTIVVLRTIGGTGRVARVSSTFHWRMVFRSEDESMKLLFKEDYF